MSNASPALHSSSWSSSTAGLLTRDHHLTVPLDRSGQGDSAPDGTESITVYAREISAVGIDPVSRPPLVFLQGGPGCEAPRPSADSGLGWIGAILEHHRLILVDQRGTGASSPVDRPDAAGTPADTARLLTHLRADEIVEDCEDLRRALGLERWSLLGQSFGGFCVTRYLSEHAQSLEKVYITGGLPAVGHSIDEVYALSYEAMRLKSEEYYTRFPQDRDRMASLVEKAGRGELRTAGGDFVGPERLRSLGALLGGPGERTRSTTSWSATPTPGPSAMTWGSACPSAAGSRSTPSSTSPAGPTPAPPTGPRSGCVPRSSTTIPPC